MRGKPWTPKDTEALKQNKHRSNAAIARLTGHSAITVRVHRNALGLQSFRGREAWTRRDWLLADAAGLDFQISV